MVARQFDVYLVALDPARGHEMKKARPCAVVSPPELNDFLQTVVVAPLTSTVRKYPFRPRCDFGGRHGQIALDQIRCVDRARLLKRLGTLDATAASATRGILVKMFS